MQRLVRQFALSEMGPRTNEHILYFGSNARQIYRIDTVTLLMAAYTRTPQALSLTIDEQRRLYSEKNNNI